MTQANRLTSAQVEQVLFTTARLTAGYDMQSVDTLLDRLSVALSSHEHGIGSAGLTADELERASIPMTKVRAGYNVEEVRDVMAHGVETLRAYERDELARRAPAAGYAQPAPGWGMNAQDLIKRLQELQAAQRTSLESPLVTARLPSGRTYSVAAVVTSADGLEITLA